MPPQTHLDGEQTFALTGLHCAKCVGRVQTALEPFAKGVAVSLQPMEVKLAALNPDVTLSSMQQAVRAAGNYELLAMPAAASPGEVLSASRVATAAAAAPSSGDTGLGWIATYRPLLLILGFVLSASVLVQLGQHAGHGMGASAVSGMETMRYFMAGIFLVFAFFKLLDVEAFAQAYAGYDLIAARWKGWGYLYPYVELALGAAYLANFAPRLTLAVTVVVMGVSAIGVVQAVMDKRRIRCACLGTVFQLPMSTVTIIEDVGMVLMALLMLLLM